MAIAIRGHFHVHHHHHHKSFNIGFHLCEIKFIEIKKALTYRKGFFISYRCSLHYTHNQPLWIRIPIIITGIMLFCVNIFVFLYGTNIG